MNSGEEGGIIIYASVVEEGIRDTLLGDDEMGMIL